MTGIDNAVLHDVSAEDAGVCLGTVGVEGDGLHHGAHSVTGTDLIVGDDTRLHVGVGVQTVQGELDLGQDAAVLEAALAVQEPVIHPGHLKVELLAHGVHEVGIGGGVVDLLTDHVEGIVEIVGGVGLVVQKILVGGDIAKDSPHGLQLDPVILGQAEADGEHGRAQTGQGIDVLLVGSLQIALQAIGILTDDGVALLGIALDGLGHPVLTLGVVVILVGVPIEHGVGHGTREPVVPVGIGGRAAEVVVLVGRTVGHEDHEEVAVLMGLLIRLLHRGSDLVDHIKGVVIVGTRMGRLQADGRFALVLIQNTVAHVQIVHADQRVRGHSAFSGIHVTAHAARRTLRRGIHKVILALQVVGVAGAEVVVEVGDGNTDIHGLAVLTISLQLGDQLGQGLGEDLLTGDTVQVIVSHGAGGIQHDNDVSASLHGNARGGQLDSGHARVVEVDGGRALVDADGALVGELGVVVDVDVQGVAGDALIGVDDGQILIDTGLAEVEVTLQHIRRNVLTGGGAVGIGHVQDGAGVGVVTGGRAHHRIAGDGRDGAGLDGDHVLGDLHTVVPNGQGVVSCRSGIRGALDGVIVDDLLVRALSISSGEDGEGLADDVLEGIVAAVYPRRDGHARGAQEAGVQGGGGGRLLSHQVHAVGSASAAHHKGIADIILLVAGTRVQTVFTVELPGRIIIVLVRREAQCLLPVISHEVVHGAVFSGVGESAAVVRPDHAVRSRLNVVTVVVVLKNGDGLLRQLILAEGNDLAVAPAVAVRDQVALTFGQRLRIPPDGGLRGIHVDPTVIHGLGAVLGRLYVVAYLQRNGLAILVDAGGGIVHGALHLVQTVVRAVVALGLQIMKAARIEAVDLHAILINGKGGHGQGSIDTTAHVLVVAGKAGVHVGELQGIAIVARLGAVGNGEDVTGAQEHGGAAQVIIPAVGVIVTVQVDDIQAIPCRVVVEHLDQLVRIAGITVAVGTHGVMQGQVGHHENGLLVALGGLGGQVLV